MQPLQCRSCLHDLLNLQETLQNHKLKKIAAWAGVSTPSIVTKCTKLNLLIAGIILTMVLINATVRYNLAKFNMTASCSTVLYSYHLLAYVLNNIMFDCINVVYVFSHVC